MMNPLIVFLILKSLSVDMIINPFTIIDTQNNVGWMNVETKQNNVRPGARKFSCPQCRRQQSSDSANSQLVEISATALDA